MTTENDTQAVHSECKRAQAENREINDGTARTIANWYYASGGSDGYRFVSTGTITDPTKVWRELGADYETMGPDDKLALDMLGTYLINAGKRGPQQGWSSLWVR